MSKEDKNLTQEEILAEKRRAKLFDIPHAKRKAIDKEESDKGLREQMAETYAREDTWLKKYREAEKEGKPLPPHPFRGF